MNRQLLKGIPELVKANIISEETGQKIADYYLLKKQASPNTMTIVLGILGALLVGGGIILIVAHNWDDLPNFLRTILSFLPLAIGQAACAYVLLKQRDNIAWREGSSLLLFFAIGACISLISQVYQLSGTLTGFLLTWTSVALPLVYLFSSTTVAIFCIINITWYACLLAYGESPRHIPYIYVLMVALIIPHYIQLYKTKPGSNFFLWMNWAIVLSATIALNTFARNPGGWFYWVYLLYCIFFCILYFIGHSKFFSERRLMSNPFRVIGAVGVLSILMMSSFRLFWNQPDRVTAENFFIREPLPYLIGAALLIAFWLAWKHFRELRNDPTGFTFIPFFVLLLTTDNFPSISAFVINAWILVISLYFIQKGSREVHLGILNVGLMIIFILSLCRFFDDTIPFAWRGIFFIAAGSGFFIANFLMLRKRKQYKKPG